MGNDILDSPATNEEPFYVIFWCNLTYFRQNKTDQTFKMGTIFTHQILQDECTK